MKGETKYKISLGGYGNILNHLKNKQTTDSMHLSDDVCQIKPFIIIDTISSYDFSIIHGGKRMSYFMKTD
jgi:hypothetical protein